MLESLNSKRKLTGMRVRTGLLIDGNASQRTYTARCRDNLVAQSQYSVCRNTTPPAVRVLQVLLLRKTKILLFDHRRRCLKLPEVTHTLHIPITILILFLYLHSAGSDQDGTSIKTPYYFIYHQVDAQWALYRQQSIHSPTLPENKK